MENWETMENWRLRDPKEGRRPGPSIRIGRKMDVWYFAWVLGIGFAVLLAILNAMWEAQADAGKLALPR
jgi:cyd operon protein YbgT